MSLFSDINDELREENEKLRDALRWAIGQVYSEFPHPSTIVHLRELEKLLK